MRKRIGCILLSIVMIGSLFVSPAFAASFTSRTTAPASSNTYYYSSANPFYSAGYAGECTWYAYGRAYEILGKKPNLSTRGATEWFNYNETNKAYPSGTTPKVGAIAWSPTGHVLVVEAIKSDGTPIFSESHRKFDKKFSYGERAADYVKNLK